MNNEYKEKAEKFLRDTNTVIYIEKAVPQTTPLWVKKGEKHGVDYSVRLKNSKHCFDFHYWGSISDAERISHGEWRGTEPNAYHILSCLGINMGNVSFSEFCDNFGYDTDSITAEKTFNACINEYNNLKKLFTQSELEKLAEIQ